MRILITGGAGYIGSHLAVALLQAGHKITIFDKFRNASPQIPERIAQAAGTAPQLCRGDLQDSKALQRAFAGPAVDLVIHLAGLKDVAESARLPLKYYEANGTGTLCLLQAMTEAGCKRLIFSSTAAVYGQKTRPPFGEDSLLAPANPYGRTKLLAEQLLSDLCASDPAWQVVIFRYANPVGAHQSGLLGERLDQGSGNLIPMLAKVALGRLPVLQIYGKDYDTPDGTGVRDYLHIQDLTEAHLAALDFMTGRWGLEVFNLGTGRGYSVLEVLEAFRQASGREIPCRFVSRRPGDVSGCWLSVEKAKRLLGWQARRDLGAMCRDAWRYAREQGEEI